MSTRSHAPLGYLGAPEADSPSPLKVKEGWCTERGTLAVWEPERPCPQTAWWLHSRCLWEKHESVSEIGVLAPHTSSSLAKTPR